MTAAPEGGERSAARPGCTLPPGIDPVPILQEAGWAPGPVWTGEKSRLHQDSISDLPARSSLAIPTELPGPHKSYLLTVRVKLDFTLEQATKAQRGSRGMVLVGVGGQRHAPAVLPPGKTLYSLYRRLSGPQSRSGPCAENLAPPPLWDSIPGPSSP